MRKNYSALHLRLSMSNCSWRWKHNPNPPLAQIRYRIPGEAVESVENEGNPSGY